MIWYILDHLLPILVKEDRVSEQISLVIDLEGKHLQPSLLDSIRKVISNHFPGRLNKILLVNESTTPCPQTETYTQNQIFVGEYVFHIPSHEKTKSLACFFDPQQLPPTLGGQPES